MSRRRKNNIFNRITFIVVLMLFALLTISMVLTVALSSIIAQAWKIDEDNIILFAVVILAISIVLGIALSFAYSAIIIRASKPYLNALQKVAEGDFSVRIEDSAVFANLNLARNFNYMVSQLDSVETLRENFVSDFSHEFKTPIVSIAGFAKLLKDPTLTAEQRNEYLDVIIDESNRLVELSESVLLLNRLESQEITKEQYQLDEQMRQCVLMFEQQCEAKGIALNVDLQDHVVINSNYKLLSQVIVNLLSNAVKFTDSGGTISVGCKTKGLNVLITVADTGCGMDEETKSNIFNKFFQGDTSHTTPGNGLGLSIVKKIVELLDGQIFVQSKLGEGSTFTISLLKGV
ncbi:MAG: HAMP domain-containing histidine kinase [Clostridiales bacterium]|nr:HAMP domain-containing histidine kinase [Clostridiales bacterium]